MLPRDRFRDLKGCPACKGPLEEIGPSSVEKHGADVYHSWEPQPIRVVVRKGSKYDGCVFVQTEAIAADGGDAFSAPRRKNGPTSERVVYLTHSCMRCATAWPKELLHPFRGELTQPEAEAVGT